MVVYASLCVCERVYTMMGRSPCVCLRAGVRVNVVNSRFGKEERGLMLLIPAIGPRAASFSPFPVSLLVDTWTMLSLININVRKTRSWAL